MRKAAISRPKAVAATDIAEKKALSKSHNRAIQRFMEIAKSKAEEADTDALERATERWMETPTTTVSAASSTKQKLVQALSHGRIFTPQESLLLELETQKRAFARRRELLHDTLTASQVAELLGTRRQTPHDRLHSKTLLAVEDGGRWKFPYWQFDPDGPHGVVRGLPEVLKALEVSDMGKISWLINPNPYLEGRSPLKALKDGEIERVVDEARAVGCH